MSTFLTTRIELHSRTVNYLCFRPACMVHRLWTIVHVFPCQYFMYELLQMANDARLPTLVLIRYHFIGQHAISHLYLFVYITRLVKSVIGRILTGRWLTLNFKNHFRKSVSSFLTEILYFEIYCTFSVFGSAVTPPSTKYL